MHADFAPGLLLRHPDVQTIAPSLPWRRLVLARTAAPLARASRPLVLDCGEGVRLLALHAPQPRPARELVVVVHGWEGSAEAPYVVSLAQHLYAAGRDVVRLNLRDHGPTHALNPGLFHSCRIDEVVGAVARVQALFPERALSLAGFSLGGNFALRVAVRAPAAALRLRRVIAVCPVLDPAAALAAMEAGMGLYARYFIRRWRRSLMAKQAAWPGRYALGDLVRLPTLSTMTDALVARYTDFPDTAAYYRGYAITGDVLAGLTVRARILAALDDPVIPARDLARLARPAALAVTATRSGGHCGFLDDPLGPSWADREALAELERE